MHSRSGVSILIRRPWFAKKLTTAKTRKTEISSLSRAPTLLKNICSEYIAYAASNETRMDGQMCVV